MLSDSASLMQGHKVGLPVAGPWAVAALLAATITLAAVAQTARAASARDASARLASPVTVSPAPGTPDASPDTQISILGPAPQQIRAVSARGSISGAHRGQLRAYTTSRGASFVLDHPLAQGERVAVQIKLRHRRPIAFAFRTANLAATPPTLDIPVQQPAKLDHYVSRPDLAPPRITILKRSRHLEGDIFLTPLPSPVVHPESNNQISVTPVGPGGPMIVDPNGNLVWFDQLAPPDVATNFRPQEYHGHEVLTWWQGSVTAAAFGDGAGVIASPDYQTLRTVRAGNGYPTDLHEFVITRSGDALFTVYSPVLVHLPGTPAGSLSPLLDSIVQEVDIRTGLVVWEWHALGHIPLRQSYATPSNSTDYDAFHVNSIQALSGNRILISARDTSAVYLVNRTNGQILWTLGGKASSFRLEPGARFYFQHDARLGRCNRITLFDDEGGPPVYAPASRGLLLQLNLKHRTAKPVRSYRRTATNHDSLADSEGNVQLLPRGNVFVGFGSTPFFSGFTADGRVSFDASLPSGDGSYREYLFPWTATPKTRPAVAVRRLSPSRVTVYASWNGATTVARWQILAGPNAAALTPRASAKKHGFETAVALSTTDTTFAVRALNAQGRALATSDPTSAS